MKIKNVLGFMLAMLTMVIVGCGGGGGGGGSTSTTVTGLAAKGPIVGGDVKIYAVKADGTVDFNAPLTTTPANPKTKAFGNYSATFNYSGPAVVEISGGTYTDEATGIQGVTAGTLRAAVANASGTTNVTVTPLTDIAVKKLSTFTPTNITAANTGVANALGMPAGFDITTASPVTDANYKFKLAVISQAASPDNGTTPGNATAVANLLTQMANGIDATTGTITDANVNTGLANATSSAFNNPVVNPTGTIPGIDGNAISGLTLTANPTTGNINVPVTINASVTKVSGGAAADGTQVTFTTSAGTITATAATAGGTAAATLSGIATKQTVTVTAKAGDFTKILTINFVNPDEPASITVTANPATGFTSGGAPVVVSAAVTRAAGGPVPNGTTVNFTTTAGTITASATTTNGVATATLTNAVVGTATVTAQADTVTGTVDVPFVSNPNLPGAISVSANPSSLFVGQGPVTLTATVTPVGQGGVIADGTVVTFFTDAGTLGSPTTTTNGVATATLNSNVAVTASVTARVASITSAPVTVQFKPQPTLAVVKVQTFGTLPVGTTIGGITATVITNPTTGLTIAPADVTSSGAGASATMLPNTTNVGSVVVGLISATGIQAGEFATLNYHIAAGNFPAPGNFTIAPGATIIDTNGQAIPNMTVTVSASIQ